MFLRFATALLVVLIATPGLAKVLAEGKPSKGFYWQKVEQKDGKILYLCRSTTNAKIQKGTACDGAGARKP
jgi:hypothetical protein